MSDTLVLTKPIGSGIITTAGKHQQVEPGVLAGAVHTMSTLNHGAADAIVKIGVNACVDITGYGLVGHLLGMLQASGVSANISVGAVPLLDGVRELAHLGLVPGGTRSNLAFADPQVIWHPSLNEIDKLLMCDAQTSGGLLVSVPKDRVNLLLKEFCQRGVETTAIIGEVLAPGSLEDQLIRVTP